MYSKSSKKQLAVLSRPVCRLNPDIDLVDKLIGSKIPSHSIEFENDIAMDLTKQIGGTACHTR